MSMKEGIDVPRPRVATLLKKHGYTLTTVESFNGGFCNPILFLGTKEGTELVLKVSHPHWKVRKTVNEATVIRFLEKNSTIPVPEVVTYSAARSELGYEYILMKRVPGRPLVTFFKDLTLKEQRTYLDQLADIVSQLLNLRYDKIGAFSADMQIGQDVEGNGPFNTVTEYIESNMKVNLRLLQNFKEYRDYARRLELFKEKVVCAYEGDCEIVLTHNDILHKNIMGEDGKITALLDWEWAMAAPSDIYFSTFSELSKDNLRYIYSVLEAKGHYKSAAVEEREDLYEIEHLTMCLACHREWFDGDKAKEQAFADDLKVKIDKILSVYGI